MARATGPLPPAPTPEALANGHGVRDYLPAHSHSLGELHAALARCQGNQSRAAQSLGLTLRQFAYRLKKAAPPPG